MGGLETGGRGSIGRNATQKKQKTAYAGTPHTPIL
jgi:hypothetical protein